VPPINTPQPSTKDLQYNTRAILKNEEPTVSHDGDVLPSVDVVPNPSQQCDEGSKRQRAVAAAATAAAAAAATAAAAAAVATAVIKRNEKEERMALYY